MTVRTTFTCKWNDESKHWYKSFGSIYGMCQNSCQFIINHIINYCCILLSLLGWLFWSPLTGTWRADPHGNITLSTVWMRFCVHYSTLLKSVYQRQMMYHQLWGCLHFAAMFLERKATGLVPWMCLESFVMCCFLVVTLSLGNQTADGPYRPL